jgi:hypothetical protein
MPSAVQQTLADTERALSPDHPNTLTSRNNLAGAIEATNDQKHHPQGLSFRHDLKVDVRKATGERTR